MEKFYRVLDKVMEIGLIVVPLLVVGYYGLLMFLLGWTVYVK
jgi:hypothetical protein